MEMPHQSQWVTEEWKIKQRNVKIPHPLWHETKLLVESFSFVPTLINFLFFHSSTSLTKSALVELWCRRTFNDSSFISIAKLLLPQHFFSVLLRQQVQLTSCQKEPVWESLKVSFGKEPEPSTQFEPCLLFCFGWWMNDLSVVSYFMA